MDHETWPSGTVPVIGLVAGLFGVLVVVGLIPSVFIPRKIICRTLLWCRLVWLLFLCRGLLILSLAGLWFRRLILRCYGPGINVDVSRARGLIGLSTSLGIGCRSLCPQRCGNAGS